MTYIEGLPDDAQIVVANTLYTVKELADIIAERDEQRAPSRDKLARHLYRRFRAAFGVYDDMRADITFDDLRPSLARDWYIEADRALDAMTEAR